MSAKTAGVLEELVAALAERVCTDDETRAAHRVDSWMLSELRTFQGRALLTPNRRLKRIAAGVLAKGMKRYESIQLYGYGFLNNHVHRGFRRGPAPSTWGNGEHGSACDGRRADTNCTGSRRSWFAPRDWQVDRHLRNGGRDPRSRNQFRQSPTGTS